MNRGLLDPAGAFGSPGSRPLTTETSIPRRQGIVNDFSNDTMQSEVEYEEFSTGAKRELVVIPKPLASMIVAWV